MQRLTVTDEHGSKLGEVLVKLGRTNAYGQLNFEGTWLGGPDDVYPGGGERSKKLFAVHQAIRYQFVIAHITESQERLYIYGTMYMTSKSLESP